jgi:hypothetical protein
LKKNSTIICATSPLKNREAYAILSITIEQEINDTCGAFARKTDYGTDVCMC